MNSTPRLASTAGTGSTSISNDAVANGYDSIGIALMTYTGRAAPCPIQGADMTPYFVRVGPDGSLGTADDVVIIAGDSDKRNSTGCTNYGGPWYLIDYQNDYYQQQYAIFIQALADHLLNHPQRDRIGWVAIGTGKDGENRAADDRTGGVTALDETFLETNGYLNQAQWVQYVKDVIDNHQSAFRGAGRRAPDRHRHPKRAFLQRPLGAP